MRSSLARVLTGTALTVGMVALGGGAASATESYTVRSGDTLAGIAHRSDDVSSWRQLFEVNRDRLDDPHRIRPGQVLAMSSSAPVTEPDTHTVVAGDTLAKIAASYPAVASWRQLAAANTDIVRDPNVIHVGQVLTLSGEAAPAPTVSSRAQTAPEPEATPKASSTAKANTTSKAAPKPKVASTSGTVPTATWDRLAECESNGNWSINTGNGYYGGLQFAKASWEWVGGSGLPHQASKAEQISRAEKLLELQGWGAWPACSRKIGLR